MSEYIVEVPEWVIDANGNPPFRKGEEIVRCKDCKYHEGLMGGVCTLWEFLIGSRVFTESHGFCSWGDRKEEQMMDIPERTCVNMQEYGFECSECDFFDAYADETRIRYCPNCGAKVVDMIETEIKHGRYNR